MSASDPSADKVRLAVPDMISPSYFPAIAAAHLGCFERRGVDVELALHFPVTSAVEALRDGRIDVLAGAAHSIFHAAPDGGGVKLLMALSQHMYWFLVVRADLPVEPDGDLAGLRGLRIGAAPGPEDGLIQLLIDAGIAIDEVEIGPVDAPSDRGISFGVDAAAALESGSIDGFWANGMGAEVAVRRGVGKIVVDARRGPEPARSYTFAALMATDRLERRRPDVLESVVGGVVDAQELLRGDATLASSAAVGVFPDVELGLIDELVARDAPFYDPQIPNRALEQMLQFAASRYGDLDVPQDGLVSQVARQTWRQV